MNGVRYSVRRAANAAANADLQSNAEVIDLLQDTMDDIRSAAREGRLRTFDVPEALQAFPWPLPTSW